MNVSAKASDCDSDRRASEGLSSFQDFALSSSEDSKDQVLKTLTTRF